MSEFEGNEGIESGASGGASPEPQDSSTQETAAQETSQAPAPEVPFHEHPRFKELVEQKNTYASQLQQYENAMRQMQQRLDGFERSQPKAAKPEDDLFKRLKEIDPVFGGKFEETASAAQRVAQVENALRQMETQQIQQQYVSGINNLFTQNNVPKELHLAYDAIIEREARNNPRLGINDLPEVFKRVHEQFNKFTESTKRATTATYVKDKAKDTTAPTSQPKGKPAGAKKAEMPMDREERLASIAKSAVAKYKADQSV